MRKLLGSLAVLLCGCSSPPPAKEAAAPPPKPRIVHFYAGAPAVERGQAGLLCYGVESATSVRLDPPVQELSPSPNRCIEVKPERETTYTLTATGADGSTAVETVKLGVVAPSRAAKPAAGGPGRMISTFVATPTEVAAGQPVTICYEVNGADSVKLQPSPQPAKPGKQCFSVTPQRTTTYNLSATGGGRTEVADLTIRVK